MQKAGGKNMIKYYCKNCEKETETSICPICGEQSYAISDIYWCDECNIPVFNDHCSCGNHNLRRISSDLRPVFPEERLLLEILLDEPFKYLNSSVWSIDGGSYIIDGKSLKIVVKDLRFRDPLKIKQKYDLLKDKNDYVAFNKYIDLFIKENKTRYDYITTEALAYVNKQVKNYEFNSMFVSFSSGKDSTVTSDIVMRALGNQKVIHIFGDTTLEFPESYDYVKRFKKEHKTTPMFAAKNRDKNFNELCELIGPPSRVMRWCCTVFKTGAITKKINTLFKDRARILTFYGIRRSESLSRSKYERESDSPKIAKQRTVSPIIDWLDFDVWLYLLTTGIDFNGAYRLGFTRVGCWCCPNNSQWSEFLSKVHHHDDYETFRNILVNNAIKIGKLDPEEYVDSGKWKAKQGGAGIDYSTKGAVSFTPCATEENAFNYELQKPITEDFYELFKPFGTLNKELGNKRLGEVYVLDRNNVPLLKLQGKIGQNLLKVSILKLPLAGSKSLSGAEGKVKCQLTKYQMCLNCSGCVSACRFGAISIKEGKEGIEYKIDEEKCVHCYNCINHYSSGCYMRKVLTVTEEQRMKINGEI